MTETLPWLLIYLFDYLAITSSQSVNKLYQNNIMVLHDSNLD